MMNMNYTSAENFYVKTKNNDKIIINNNISESNDNLNNNHLTSINHKYKDNSSNDNYIKYINNSNNKSNIHSNVENKIYNKINNALKSNNKNSLKKFNKKKKNVINNSDKSWRESPKVEQAKIRQIEEKIHEQRKRWEARKNTENLKVTGATKEKPKKR